jgi:hypothetical protein
MRNTGNGIVPRKNRLVPVPSKLFSCAPVRYRCRGTDIFNPVEDGRKIILVFRPEFMYYLPGLLFSIFLEFLHGFHSVPNPDPK